MLSRLTFLLVTLFWLTMNFLLWRSEFASTADSARPLPVETVWQKMLTAPDDSNLEIFQRGKRLGGLRWSPNVEEAASTGKTSPDNFQPEGRIATPADYTIDVSDGTVTYGEPSVFLRFNFSARFTTNHVWQTFSLRLAQRRTTVELRAEAAKETLQLRVRDEDAEWSRALTFAELRNPEKLLQELGGSLPVLLLLGGLGGGVGGSATPGKVSLGIHWEAYNDWLKVGHSQLRVYRLQTRLMDRHRIVVFVSRIGEILRVELPNEISLTNTALTLF